ncbi:MAG: single-stranded-DNA-specific exonuclease RecJ [Berkelbacteria bacterium GW2011_GWA2_35_9]|uniref:Single-stranded-DNA-specific exonuclease RecJ n=1 Tax=Berkelbacteria bacterium GW2011_GWA2_35_9 TaxID=1618333 RepID=A0A0G0FN79_9BACT|nr:MAG: single-stranded-DNA-specific exonuclease RecJ [Berkelbacteria bacterium GW2011_GWA2_35_9]
MKYEWVVPKNKNQEIFDQIIESRNISKSQLNKYLKPNFFGDQTDPRLIGGLEKSIKRIKKALDIQENIGIFCDYDADGIPSGAMLYKAFSKYNQNLFVFIPTRQEGYGISEKSLDYFSNKKCSLVIAVDVGITAKVIAEKFKQKKIDLIIIDHHLIIKDLYPKSALAVIDLKNKNEKYPFKDFSAGGLVWKLLYAIHLEFQMFSEPEIKWFLDLACISTISDIVPLVGENWLISKFGLIVLSKTKNIGLKKLIEIASIDPEKIDEYSVGFQIGPRLNASGRMADPIDSFNLLFENNRKNVKILAEKLDKNNRLRQVQMKEAFCEAQVKIEKMLKKEDKIIIVKSENWQEGILGLVASKIVDKYYLPAIVFKEKKDQLIGSARSIQGFDVEQALEKNKVNIESFGGHKMAAGLRIKKEKYNKFREAITQFASATIDSKLLTKKINIDARTNDCDELNLKLYYLIEKLRPFGEGHRQPVIMLKNVNISDVREIGKEKNHLSFLIDRKLKAVYFSFPQSEKIRNRENYDICGKIILNTWGGQKKIEFQVIDLRQTTAK